MTITAKLGFAMFYVGGILLSAYAEASAVAHGISTGDYYAAGIGAANAVGMAFGSAAGVMLMHKKFGLKVA